jgi:hypothetical protein
MDHNSSLLPKFIMLRHMQAKKKLRNKQNRSRSQLRRLLQQLIRYAKSRRKLNVLYRQLNVVALLLKRSFSMLPTSKLEKSSKRQPKHYVKIKSNVPALLRHH